MPADWYDSTLARLHGVVQTRTGWSARCPAHDDHRPSLTVSIGRDGQILMYCQSQHCSIDAITAAIGLRVGDLFPNLTGMRLGRKQQRRLAPYREMMADADLFRAMWGMVQSLRAEATRLGDTPKAWDLLDHAASIERDCQAWEASR